jgi:hypothetical protein
VFIEVSRAISAPGNNIHISKLYQIFRIFQLIHTSIPQTCRSQDF